jgi:hypothetical protein
MPLDQDSIQVDSMPEQSQWDLVAVFQAIHKRRDSSLTQGLALAPQQYLHCRGERCCVYATVTLKNSLKEQKSESDHDVDSLQTEHLLIHRQLSFSPIAITQRGMFNQKPLNRRVIIQ